MKTRLSALLSAAILVPAFATPAFAQGEEAATLALPLASSVVVLSADADAEAGAAALVDGAVSTKLDAGLTAAAATLELGGLGTEAAGLAAATTSSTQVSGTSGREQSFTVMLSQDSFFGFYPSFNGLIPVSENMDFSFYGIMWTKPAFSLSAPTGDDLWTEFGMGVNFYLDDGRLKIKPQIGITNGALLSGGAIVGGDTAGSNALDGLVPSLTVNYANDAFELEYYGGYYAALRGRNEDASLDFLHTWINFGYKATDNLSFGPHYELLANTRNTYPGGSPSNTYSWLGGYIQFALDNGFFARFTTGADLNDSNAGDFYKLGMGFTF